MEIIDRYRGALLGLACGDALGTTLEFESSGTFKPVTDIVGGGPFGLKPGEWTDDTTMALCLAENLIECNGFDPADQMTRYLRWYREGNLSSNGRCFDIGNTTRDALTRFERTGEPYSGSTDKYSAGNRSIMRLAPVPLFFPRPPKKGRYARKGIHQSLRSKDFRREGRERCPDLRGLRPACAILSRTIQGRCDFRRQGMGIRTSLFGRKASSQDQRSRASSSFGGTEAPRDHPSGEFSFVGGNYFNR
jgi:hypothetical protein